MLVLALEFSRSGSARARTPSLIAGRPSAHGAVDSPTIWVSATRNDQRPFPQNGRARSDDLSRDRMLCRAGASPERSSGFGICRCQKIAE